MASIETPGGRIDYDECGDGPTIVLVPGSCSTGAAWRPVIAALGGRFRCVFQANRITNAVKARLVLLHVQTAMRNVS